MQQIEFGYVPKTLDRVRSLYALRLLCDVPRQKKGLKETRRSSCMLSLFTLSLQPSRYSDWLRAGRSGNRIPVWARFSASVHTDPGAHPASCTMGTGSFLGVKSGRVMTLTPHPLLVPWSRKSRSILLLPLCAVRPVQSLSACTRVHFTFIFTLYRLVAFRISSVLVASCYPIC